MHACAHGHSHSLLPATNTVVAGGHSPVPAPRGIRNSRHEECVLDVAYGAAAALMVKLLQPNCYLTWRAHAHVPMPYVLLLRLGGNTTSAIEAARTLAAQPPSPPVMTSIPPPPTKTRACPHAAARPTACLWTHHGFSILDQALVVLSAYCQQALLLAPAWPAAIGRGVAPNLTALPRMHAHACMHLSRHQCRALVQACP